MMLCYATLRYATLRYEAARCYAMPCYAMLCYGMLCSAMMLRYAMRCYSNATLETGPCIVDLLILINVFEQRSPHDHFLKVL